MVKGYDRIDVGILYYQMVSFFHWGYFLSLFLVGVFDLLFYVYSLITHLNTALSQKILFILDFFGYFPSFLYIKSKSDLFACSFLTLRSSVSSI